MARSQSRERSTEQNPSDFAVTTPPRIGRDYDFTLHSIMELQKTVGQLIERIDGLTSQIKEQNKTLEWIKRVLWFTAGVVFLGSIVGGYIFDKRFDEILSTLVK